MQVNRLVAVIGAGDMATGIACRLFRSGFPVVMTEISQPTAIRRPVAFAQAIYDGEATVEGIKAVRVAAPKVYAAIAAGLIPVIVDPDRKKVLSLRPGVLVDAVIAKKNTGTHIQQAPIVIGVGPGFTPGQDVHAVVETMRGHHLGRVLTERAAAVNTGIPGDIGGYTVERILRAPADGLFVAVKCIGDQVDSGELIARVGEQEIIAPISGTLRGLLQNHLRVRQNMKVGDIDPRCDWEYCFTISDKARAVGGGVLEAILRLAGELAVSLETYCL